MLDLGRRYQSMTRNGPGGFALSGIDMALWDIAGKAAQKPVYELLGGKKRSKVPVYASLMRVVKPDLVKNLCLKTLDLGYRYIKLHEHTGEAVAAARAAIGPKIPLMVDVNCHWLTVEDCLKEARKMQPSDVYWLEEPLYPPDDLVGLVRLRKEAGMPLAMGENLGNLTEYQRVADAAAVDYVQPSVAKMGGISGLVKTMAYVESKGLKAIPHSPYVGPALIATLQVLAAHKNELVCEHRSVALEAHPIGDCVVSKDGYLKVPEGPGLGFEVDEDLVRKYRLPV
jgi:L-alanine-DL-glutamate epimerase-like enolase superfamily enzyme